jgi:uncharacterized protein YegL
MSIGKPEFVDNPEPRCPVVLLLDTSGSMQGEPIRQLNSGIEAFRESISRDQAASLRVEVAVVTFGDSVRLVTDFVTIDRFKPVQLSAVGGTPMGEAISYTLELLEDRKVTYKSSGVPYYQPWVFMITDGAPTDSWQMSAQKVKQAEQARKLSFFAVAVLEADINTLKQIAPSNRPPVQLQGLNFNEMFVWLSQSLSRVSVSKPGEQMTDLPPLGWGQVPN